MAGKKFVPFEKSAADKGDKGKKEGSKAEKMMDAKQMGKMMKKMPSGKRK